MIRFLLRVLVVLAVLTSPVVASWPPTPVTGAAGPALDLVLDGGSAERCLLPPAACSPCQACLAVLGDTASGAEAAYRGSRPPPFADALVGLPSLPEPIPP